ncbi:hypothetical protein ACIA8E_33035 [Streptomyces sp. NPDC051664]|uniref:hypothetical protein n=1 Tax=Streptomyces sp. NPDC051664 TaxID=3365668 RepID=UPI00379D20C1
MPPDPRRTPVDRLRTVLGEKPLIEPTTMVAMEDLRSRTDSARGLTSQGFKECKAPRAAARGTAHTSR